ncbi:hypothetical protein MNBD_GAMMA21-134 [hydrothermal vent metagenome]|uniref:Uncharacterized protein n=1 Tax=hydrothermal vent metagenome TaxID=652676 RepID=A0A3B1AMC3_9ZZZZ
MDWKTIGNMDVYTNAKRDLAQRDNIALNSPPLQPSDLPQELLARLQSHYTNWSLQDKNVNVNASELRKSDSVMLFEKQGKDWVSVQTFSGGVALGESAYAVSRRSLRNPSKGGGSGRGSDVMGMASPAKEDEVLVPTVRITSPADGDIINIADKSKLQNEINTFTINDGESVAAFAQRVTGKADPDSVYNFNNGRVTQNRPPVGGDELRVLTGKKLKVDGSVSNSQTVTLSWDGGAESMDVGKSSPNSTMSWNTGLPAKPGDYVIAARASGATHAIKLKLIELFELQIAFGYKDKTIIKDEEEKISMTIDAKVTGAEEKEYTSKGAKQSEFSFPELPNGDYALEMNIYNLENCDLK